MHNLYFIRLLSPTKCQYRDKKLNSILRRQYDFILKALGENIFRIGRSRDATEPNTEYIFSQLAVNIKSYCRLKIEFSLYNVCIPIRNGISVRYNEAVISGLLIALNFKEASSVLNPRC